MSRGFLGYVGTIPDASGFDRTEYTGVATHQDTNALNSIQPIFDFKIEFPSGYGVFAGGSQVQYSDPELEAGVLLNGNANVGADGERYPGGYKLTIGKTCTLEFHIWGAGGADSTSGHGGYTKYKATFQEDTIVGLYIPGWNGEPSSVLDKRAACWPDAGHGGTGANYHGFSGGGSARVGTWYTNLSNMNASSAHYYAIAGGGGGSHQYYGSPGNGGGSSGTAASTGSYSAGGGGGGTQSAGGTGGSASSYGGAGQNGSKYQGGNGVAYSSYGGGGGGGGGYYGGGAGGTVYASGGGGSGYVDTGFSGYITGSTTAADGDGPPAGVGYTRPTNVGEGNYRGAIFLKKV